MPAPDLESLYDVHAAAVFAFAMTLTRQEAEARDILQEVFGKYACHPSALPVANARAYLLRIAHNLFVDRLRRENSHERMLKRLRQEESASLFAPSSDPDMQTFRTALNAALGKLPTEQRAVAYLKLWEGQTFAEIAALLGIPLHTAAGMERGHPAPRQARPRRFFTAPCRSCSGNNLPFYAESFDRRKKTSPLRRAAGAASPPSGSPCLLSN